MSKDHTEDFDKTLKGFYAIAKTSGAFSEQHPVNIAIDETTWVELIKSAFSTELQAVIGEQEPKPTSHANKVMLDMEWRARQIRNQLRARQRAAAQKRGLL